MTDTATTQRRAPTAGGDRRTEALWAGVATGPSRSVSRESLEAARAGITQPGCYLIYHDFDGEPIVSAVKSEIVRIGRSLHADIRFEDPTVSRRHALIIRQEGEVRVVDERSRNGVFLGGEQVLSSALSDGDELTIGRHHILFVHVPPR